MEKRMYFREIKNEVAFNVQLENGHNKTHHTSIRLKAAISQRS